jgi:hypothetical protein
MRLWSPQAHRSGGKPQRPLQRKAPLRRRAESQHSGYHEVLGLKLVSGTMRFEPVVTHLPRASCQETEAGGLVVPDVKPYTDR